MLATLTKAFAGTFPCDSVTVTRALQSGHRTPAKLVSLLLIFIIFIIPTLQIRKPRLRGCHCLGFTAGQGRARVPHMYPYLGHS